MSSVDRNAAYQAHLASVAQQRAEFWKMYVPAAAALGLGPAALAAALNWWMTGNAALLEPLAAGVVLTLVIAVMFARGGRYPAPMTRGEFDSAAIFDAALRATLVSGFQRHEARPAPAPRAAVPSSSRVLTSGQADVRRLH